MFGFKRKHKKKQDILSPEEIQEILDRGLTFGIMEERVELTPEQEKKLQDMIKKLESAEKRK